MAKKKILLADSVADLKARIVKKCQEYHPPFRLHETAKGVAIAIEIPLITCKEMWQHASTLARYARDAKFKKTKRVSERPTAYQLAMLAATIYPDLAAGDPDSAILLAQSLVAKAEEML